MMAIGLGWRIRTATIIPDPPPDKGEADEGKVFTRRCRRPNRSDAYGRAAGV